VDFLISVKAIQKHEMKRSKMQSFVKLVQLSQLANPSAALLGLGIFVLI
jgi:hypothetical protein